MQTSSTSYDAYIPLDKSLEEFPQPEEPPTNVRKPSNVGSHSLQGRRASQEDTHITEVFPDGSVLVGVFDGHGGVDVADYCGEHFARVLWMRYKERGDRELAMSDAFKQIAAEMIRYKYTGSTAVVAWCFGSGRNRGVLFANLGDSEGVLFSSSGDILFRTIPHKPDDEKARIQSLGGSVRGGRVGGSLAVARAFGDGYYHPYVSTEPDIVYYNFVELGCRIVLACDGLWDVLEKSYVRSVTDDLTLSPQKMAEMLCDKAYNKASTDNITTIVVLL